MKLVDGLWEISRKGEYLWNKIFYDSDMFSVLFSVLVLDHVVV